MPELRPIAAPAAPAAPALAASARDALRLSREVLSYLPSGVIFFDAAGHVAEVNPAARAALGIDRPVGLSLADLFGEAELREPNGASLGKAAALMLDACRSLRPLQRKNIRYTTPHGHGRRLGVTLFPLRGQHQDAPPAGMICLLTDLTDIHALEEELRRRQNLSALGEMSAGIAHEFKNGLATISGYGQMLRTAVPVPARAQVEKILEQVAMLNLIATDFLAFARPLAVQPERVELQRLLQECGEAMHVQDFPQVRVGIEGSFPPVAGDAGLLHSAFLNLLRNSCEAITQSGRGGSVTVRCPAAGAQRVRVHVCDDGPGVPPEVAEKIFIPFFTTKPTGTGLGLAMVHKIITAHQGSVLLVDAAAGHTVFELDLPAAPEATPRL